MLFDWVRIPDRHTNKQVVSTNSKAFQYWDIGSYYNVICDDGDSYLECEEEELLPIPLTPEILKLNGFQYIATDRNTIFRLTTDQRTLFVSMDKKGDMELMNRYVNYGHGDIDSSSICRIQYVHELQRALRCCGLWVLANRFKVE